MSLLGVILFSYLVLLMHMFLSMFTCMEERPAMSRADFQARRDSSQGNWTSYSHCHVNCGHTVTVRTHTQLVTVFLSSSTRRLVLQWRNLHTNSERWVLHFNSQGQDVSQGLSSRTVTSMSLISIVIRRLYQTCVDL